MCVCECVCVVCACVCCVCVCVVCACVCVVCVCCVCVCVCVCVYWVQNSSLFCKTFSRLSSKSDLRLEGKELDNLERAMVIPKNIREVM